MYMPPGDEHSLLTVPQSYGTIIENEYLYVNICTCY